MLRETKIKNFRKYYFFKKYSNFFTVIFYYKYYFMLSITLSNLNNYNIFTYKKSKSVL